MLRSLKDLEGYTASATDGDVGRAVDFLLDDERWAVPSTAAKHCTYVSRSMGRNVGSAWVRR